MTEDKTEVSARVDWAGVGVNLRTDTPSATKVGAAVQRVLGDDRYRLRAAEIGEAIRRSPGPDAVHGIITEALAKKRQVA